MAVVALADSAIELAHAPALPAGIAIRGFRCVLRVKQLDPVAGFLHSHQHAPAAHDFMLHPAWSAITGQPSGSDRRGDPAAVLLEQQLLLGLETYALQSSLGDLVEAALATPPSAGLAAALARRLAVIRLYAPSLLTLMHSRLAAEFGGDPDSELPNNRDYAFWFAEQLGRQLGVFYELRFLHDYLHQGIARWKPGHIYSLGKNNVSLMAEFPDLDTGIFLDCPDPEQLDSLFITRADYDALDSGFAEFHQHDVTAARQVVKTLAFVALDADPGGIVEAQRRFTTAYQRGTDAAA